MGYDLNKRHQEMLAFQDKIHPFTPTLAELMEVWHLSTKSAVVYVLKKLVERGLCVTRGNKVGKYTRYYAVNR
jgi:DNA-binding MarR family transcriptional regulator